MCPTSHIYVPLHFYWDLYMDPNYCTYKSRKQQSATASPHIMAKYVPETNMSIKWQISQLLHVYMLDNYVSSFIYTLFQNMCQQQIYPSNATNMAYVQLLDLHFGGSKPIYMPHMKLPHGWYSQNCCTQKMTMPQLNYIYWTCHLVKCVKEAIYHLTKFRHCPFNYENFIIISGIYIHYAPS